MKELSLKKLGLRRDNWGKLGLELLVVFLGVTSGFLLNSWREGQQELKMEQKYISGFIKDVSDNIDQLEELVSMDSVWLKQARISVMAIKENSLTLDSAEAMVKKIVVINKMEPHEGTYEDITNSGNLSIIQNFELKSKIVDYQIAIKGIRFIDDYFYKYFNDFVMPFVISNFNVLTGHFENDNSYKSLEFSNAFVGYFSMVQQRQSAYKDLLVKSKDLKESLQKSKY